MSGFHALINRRTHSISLLLFASNGCKYPELPLDIVVSNCYSAIAPPDIVWTKYIEKINYSIAIQEITDKDYVELRKMNLLYDYSKFSNLSYSEIINIPVPELKNAIQKERQNELDAATQKAKSEAENFYQETISALKHEKEQKNKESVEAKFYMDKAIENEYYDAEKFATKIIWGVSLTVALLIVISNAYEQFIKNQTIKDVLTFTGLCVTIYGILPFDKTKIKSNLIKWHLNKHGHLTKQLKIEPKNNENANECFW